MYQRYLNETFVSLFFVSMFIFTAFVMVNMLMGAVLNEFKTISLRMKDGYIEEK